ncbi:carbohydrate ABC transporter permease [Dactylosporangium sp. CA-152071]|uniref:carbohydrate ABC transporter permease n=1 Tax=Dactylosporangium sp. CA-152071 TaxID=3239933 RepID=UPI003D913ECD
MRRSSGFLYAVPTALLVVVLFVGPLGLMAWMSLNHWPLLGASAPNGVANYEALREPLFTRAIVFSIKYTLVATVLVGLMAFGLALLVQRPGPAMTVFRTVFFLPAAVGLASASLLFYGMFNHDASPLNAFAALLGSDGVDWLGDGDNALYSTAVMITWKFAGYYMVIIMAGLQSINPLLYEAATIEGATRWQMMRRITLPLLRPTMTLVLVLLVTSSLLAFDQFFILTGGRHGTATVVIGIYREAFTSQDLGRAAAISVGILAVLYAVNGAQVRFLRSAR